MSTFLRSDHPGDLHERAVGSGTCHFARASKVASFRGVKTSTKLRRSTFKAVCADHVLRFEPLSIFRATTMYFLPNYLYQTTMRFGAKAKQEKEAAFGSSEQRTNLLCRCNDLTDSCISLRKLSGAIRDR